MEEPFESYFDNETLSLVRRFEKMIQQGQHLFFDIMEFEEIIEYYFFKNDQRKALLSINQALEQHPETTSILIKLAQFHINANKDREALRILKDIEHCDALDSDLHLAKGNLYSQLEKPEKAIEEYQKAITGAEYLDEIYSSIAFEYENTGKYDLAIDYLLKALQLNPENDAAIYEFAFCCEVSQKTDYCIEFLRNFLNINPYSVAAWFNLGIAYSNIELYEKAIDAYDFVLAIDDTFSSAYFNKANCHANTGDYNKAIETYVETFFYEDAEPITYYYIAECYEKLKKFNLSIEYYQKAIKLDPEFADAWMGLGISYDELGKPQSALPFIEKAIKLSPAIAEYWFIQGDIQIKLSQLEDGINSYRKVTELDPEDPDIWLDLSVVFADQKNYKNGYDVLLEGLNYHQSNVDFYFGMAYYLYMMGNLQQGGEMLHKAMEMDKEGYKRLCSTFPEAATHQEILLIVESYRARNL